VKEGTLCYNSGKRGDMMASDMQRALSYMRQAADDYAMIDDGDKIAVGVSGGKDSLTLLTTLAQLKNFYPKKFELYAVSVDMGYDDMSFEKIEELCERLNVPYYIERTDIREIIFDIRKEKNPCSLCAKMRRGALNSAAQKLGCNKTALGHHFDDVIETFVMNLIYEGRLGCFSPVTHLDKTGITVIRPMIYMPENFVRSLAKKLELPVVKNMCTADGNTKREYVKNLIFEQEKESRGVKKRIFTAIKNSGRDGW
jgi:tRNA(Ile)-lysidine synthase TilS/MesJ